MDRFQYNLSYKEHKTLANIPFKKSKFNFFKYNEVNDFTFDNSNIILYNDSEYIDCSSITLINKIIKKFNIEKYDIFDIIYFFRYLKNDITEYFLVFNSNYGNYYCFYRKTNFEELEHRVNMKYIKFDEYMELNEKYNLYDKFLLITRKRYSDSDRKIILFKQIHQELEEGYKKMEEKSYAPPNGYNYQQLLLKWKNN